MANGNDRIENCGLDRAARRGRLRLARDMDLEVDDDGLFILDFGMELTFGFGVAHPHGLARQAIGEHFDFEGNIQRAVAHQAIDQLTALHHRPLPDGAGEQRLTSLDALSQFNRRVPESGLIKRFAQ